MRSHKPILQRTGMTRRLAIDLTADDSDDDAGPTRPTGNTRNDFENPKVKVEAGYAPPPNSGLGESSRQRDRGRDRDRDRDHHHHHYQAQDHDNDSDGNCVHADGEHDDDSDIEVFDIKDGEYQPSESRQSLKSLFEKWPKGEAKAAILRELQSEESESLWESWVTKYPSGKIDPTDLRDFLLPHRALHRIVGFHYPTSPIDEIYRPHLTNIRKAAIWLFRELAYGSWTLYVRRLTRALRSLSVAPTLVQPPCSACHKRDIPCLEGQKQHCFHCLLANITVCLRSTPAQAAARSQPPSGGRSKPCTYIYGSAKVCPTKKRPRFSNRNDNQARGNTKRRDADMRETRDTAAQAPRDSVLYLLDATPETFNHDPHSTRTTIRMNNVDRSPATGSNTVLHEGDAEGHTIVGGINVVDVRDRRLALEMLGTHLRHDPDDERKKYGEYIFSCLQKIIDSGGEELDRVLLELHYHATEDEPDEKRRRKALFILTQLEKEVAKVIRAQGEKDRPTREPMRTASSSVDRKGKRRATETELEIDDWDGFMSHFATQNDDDDDDDDDLLPLRGDGFQDHTRYNLHDVDPSGAGSSRGSASAHKKSRGAA